MGHVFAKLIRMAEKIIKSELNEKVFPELQTFESHNEQLSADWKALQGESRLPSLAHDLVTCSDPLTETQLMIT